jgi:hypothetical protein
MCALTLVFVATSPPGDAHDVETISDPAQPPNTYQGVEPVAPFQMQNGPYKVNTTRLGIVFWTTK